jgi:hypothetical protein
MLFKTIDDVKLYIKVNGTVDIRNLEPFGNDAQEKYLRPFLGATLFTELTTYTDDNEAVPEWNSITPEDVKNYLEQLLPFAKNALAKFIFVLSSPITDLQITDGGFQVIMNQNMAPASAERVKKFTEGLEVQGYDCIETMLRFLEAKVDQYPSWKSSEAYTRELRNFINSAEEFNKYVNIGSSRLTFLRWRNTIDNVEILQVDPVISPDLASKIRLQIQEKEVSDANKKILPYLCRAVANFAASVELQDPKFERLGEHYLGEARKIMDASVDDYPEYKASTAYSTTRTSYAPYENSSDTGFFVFGG